MPSITMQLTVPRDIYDRYYALYEAMKAANGTTHGQLMQMLLDAYERQERGASNEA